MFFAVILDRLVRDFFLFFVSCFSSNECRVYFVSTNYCVYILKFRLCDHNIYRERFSSAKPHDSFIQWSCEIMGQIKNNISPLSQYLWSSDLAGWWHTVSSSHLTVTWSFNHTVLQSHFKDKLNMLHLHLH